MASGDTSEIASCWLGDRVITHSLSRNDYNDQEGRVLSQLIDGRHEVRLWLSSGGHTDVKLKPENLRIESHHYDDQYARLSQEPACETYYKSLRASTTFRTMKNCVSLRHDSGAAAGMVLMTHGVQHGPSQEDVERAMEGGTLRRYGAAVLCFEEGIRTRNAAKISAGFRLDEFAFFSSHDTLLDIAKESAEDDADAAFIMSKAYLRGGNVEKAFKEAQRAVEISSKGHFLVNLAYTRQVVAVQKGEFHSPTFQKALLKEWKKAARCAKRVTHEQSGALSRGHNVCRKTLLSEREITPELIERVEGCRANADCDNTLDMYTDLLMKGDQDAQRYRTTLEAAEEAVKMTPPDSRNRADALMRLIVILCGHYRNRQQIPQELRARISELYWQADRALAENVKFWGPERAPNANVRGEAKQIAEAVGVIEAPVGGHGPDKAARLLQLAKQKYLEACTAKEQARAAARTDAAAAADAHDDGDPEWRVLMQSVVGLCQDVVFAANGSCRCCADGTRAHLQYEALASSAAAHNALGNLIAAGADLRSACMVSPEANEQGWLVLARFAERRAIMTSAQRVLKEGLRYMPGNAALAEELARVQERELFIDSVVVTNTSSNCRRSPAGRALTGTDTELALPGCTAKSDKRDKQLLKCGKCRVVWYCSKEHQVQHWKAHKKVCGVE